MKTVLAAAALAATMIAGSTLSASAVTTNLGVLPDGYASLLGRLNIPKGAFSDTYTFSLTGPLVFDTSFSVTATTTTPISIANFTLKLFETAPTPSLIDSSSVASATTGSTVALTDNLDAGSYKFTVTGTVTAPNGTKGKIVGNYGGPLTVASVSTVPLPSSVAMFGVAVAGFGLFGALRKKKTEISVAAV